MTADEPFDWVNPRKATFAEQEQMAKDAEEFDKNLTNEAREIYESGKFIEFCQESFHKNWYGDSDIFLAILLQTANNYTGSHTGINIHLNGPSQIGKSDLARNAGKYLPLLYDGSFSKLALYSPLVVDNSVLFTDDITFDEDTASIIRGILTAYDDGVGRLTYEDKKWISKKTAKHLQLILTSVEDIARDDSQNQNESRYLSIELRRSPEAKHVIFEALQQPTVDTKREQMLAKRVWTLIEPRCVKIHKIFKEDEVPSPLFRDMTRFLALIKAHAILCNRSETNEDDVKAVWSILSQSRISLSETVAGLTKNEAIVWQALGAIGKTIGEIQTETKLARTSVIRALVGINGSVSNPKGGLSAKMPGLNFKWERSETETNVFLISKRA